MFYPLCSVGHTLSEIVVNVLSSLQCCVECAEKYCQLCFAKFHQKGALSMHHAKPLLNMVRCKWYTVHMYIE